MSALSAPPSPFYRALDNVKDLANDALEAVMACLYKPSPKLKINGRIYKVVRLLGEGGFSFVYLVEDEASGRQFALKKIRCPTGSEGVKEAMREVDAYRRFKHPNIIRIMDSAVVQDIDGEGKIVYLFLPLYKRGNLQDAINEHNAKGTRFSEGEIVYLFRGTCEAVRAMHAYRAPASASANAPAAKPNKMMPSRTDLPDEHASSSQPLISSHDNAHSDDEDEGMLQAVGDSEGGYSYHGGKTGKKKQKGKQVANSGLDVGDVIFDGDEEVAGGDTGDVVPYAHRDLKPGNVMVADDGTPILMDFGSTVKARIKIENRQQALLQQDIAAEQSTMAYRAPELFDVKTGRALDEKVDIWSLGCVLFALAYLHSPFENTQTTEQGGSIALAVMNAQYKHPASASSTYSQGLRDLIDYMLQADPEKRPDIHEVIKRLETVSRSSS